MEFVATWIVDLLFFAISTVSMGLLQFPHNRLAPLLFVPGSLVPLDQIFEHALRSRTRFGTREIMTPGRSSVMISAALCNFTF